MVATFKNYSESNHLWDATAECSLTQLNYKEKVTDSNPGSTTIDLRNRQNYEKSLAKCKHLRNCCETYEGLLAPKIGIVERDVSLD